MRKYLISVLVIAFTVSMLFIGCKEEVAEAVEEAAPTEEVAEEEVVVEDETAVAEDTSPFIGSEEEVYWMSTFISGHPFWKKVYAGFVDAANALGVTSEYGGGAEFELTSCVAAFEQIAAGMPAGIAVTCMNAPGYIQSINMVMDAGVNVVTFDADSPLSNRLAFLGTGNFAAGAVAARHMAELIGGKGQVATIRAFGLGNAEDRRGGFVWAIEQEYPDIEIVAEVDTEGDNVTGAANFAPVLVQYPDLVGVFGADGAGGLSAAVPIKEAGKTGTIKVVVFDTDTPVLDMIKTGEIDATMVQGLYNMGFWSMTFLYVAKHEISGAPLPSNVDTGVTVLTADNPNFDDFYYDE